jgi:membrane protease YdiL (CAAX protease family)
VGGLIFYLVILFSLIVNAALTRDPAQRGLWLALGLAPTIRVISLALPVMLEISQLIWYIVIAIPILVGIIVVARTLKYGLADIGLLWNDPTVQILVAFAGFFLAAAGFMFLKTTAWTTVLTLQSTLFPALVLLIFTGFVEELAFRGVMQQAAGALGSYGWVYIAAVYAVLQIQQGSLEYCLFGLVAGLFFGYVVKLSGSIIGVSLAHGLINIGLFLVFPHIF